MIREKKMRKNEEIDEGLSEGSKKAEYIASSLSKIRHKKWELYIVSRILNLLDDPEIEFVCQQLILRDGDKRALADLYFPQFNICIEIQERGSHSSEQQRQLDKARNTEIIKAIGADIWEIKNFIDREDDQMTDASLSYINNKIYTFVDQIKERKENQQRLNKFQPWTITKKFDPTPYIERGYLDADENPSFKYIKDALRCFGYSGGLYQKATWRAPDWDRRIVWFPSFVPHKTWRNRLLDDQKTIIEELLDPDLVQKHSEPLEHVYRYTFAKIKNRLGETAYRFLGEFKYQQEVKSDDTIQRQYVLTRKRINL